MDSAYKNIIREINKEQNKVIQEYLNEIYSRVKESIETDDINKIIEEYVKEIYQRLTESEAMNHTPCISWETSMLKNH